MEEYIVGIDIYNKAIPVIIDVFSNHPGDYDQGGQPLLLYQSPGFSALVHYKVEYWLAV